jgi:hypothetical protein
MTWSVVGLAQTADVSARAWGEKNSAAPSITIIGRRKSGIRINAENFADVHALMTASSLIRLEFLIPFKFEIPGYSLSIASIASEVRIRQYRNTNPASALPRAFANYLFREFFKSDRSIRAGFAG